MYTDVISFLHAASLYCYTRHDIRHHNLFRFWDGNPAGEKNQPHKFSPIRYTHTQDAKYPIPDYNAHCSI